MWEANTEDAVCVPCREHQSWKGSLGLSHLTTLLYVRKPSQEEGKIFLYVKSWNISNDLLFTNAGLHLGIYWFGNYVHAHCITLEILSKFSTKAAALLPHTHIYTQ